MIRNARKHRCLMTFCAAILLPAGVAIAGDAPTKPAPRPDWCKPGWSCIETKELARDALFKINLEERVAIAEARLKARRRLGWHIVAGFGVAAVATADFDVKAVPAGFAGVGWGW